MSAATSDIQRAKFSLEGILSPSDGQRARGGLVSSLLGVVVKSL